MATHQKHRCPSCGYQRLRLPMGEQPLEDQVCQACMQEIGWKPGAHRPVESMSIFYPLCGHIGHMGTARHLRRTSTPADREGEDYPRLRDYWELPF